MLPPTGALGAPCPPLMFVQWCEDDGEGAAVAAFADPALTAVVPDVEDEVVDLSLIHISEPTRP